MDKDKWYLSTTYDETKRIISARLQNMSRDFIAVGFYLKYVRDNEMYLEDGYKDIWEFASELYGIQRSTASRWMAINDKFSVDGNSPILLEQYKQFRKSQLQEMLYLPDEKLSEVTVDMTVKEIRELKMDEPKEEPVSILGYPLKVYPEGSLVTTPGCGNQNCYSCHRDGCELRQEDCYCVEAPMGNPFPCLTLNVVENLRQEIGNKCQFVNEDLAFHRAGDGQPVPCCKKCNDPCGYECNRSSAKRYADKKAEQYHSGEISKEELWNSQASEKCATSHKDKDVQAEDIPKQMDVYDYPELIPEEMQQSEGIIDAEYKEVKWEEQEPDENTWGDLFKPTPQSVLEEEREKLDQFIEVFEGEKDVPEFVEKQRIIVDALAAMVSELEDETIEQIQPDFPVLKNNEQRKEWLSKYQTWPIWFEVPNASEVYHRYDFPDGYSIVVCEYCVYLEWKERYADENPHTIYKRLYLLKPGYKYLHDCLTNETALIEFLKSRNKKSQNQ